MSSFGEVTKKFSLNSWDQREFFLVLIFFSLLSCKTDPPKCIKCACLHSSAPFILFIYV